MSFVVDELRIPILPYGALEKLQANAEKGIFTSDQCPAPESVGMCDWISFGDKTASDTNLSSMAQR